VNLIDEQHVVGLEVCQDGGEVAGALQDRPRCALDPHAQLMGNDVGEGGFPEAGRPAEQHVIERLAPAARGIDEYAQVVLDAVLTHELIEPRRSQPAVDLLFVIIQFGLYDSVSHRAPPPSVLSRTARRADRSFTAS
jgi:hypothetical protein